MEHQMSDRRRGDRRRVAVTGLRRRLAPPACRLTSEGVERVVVGPFVRPTEHVMFQPRREWPANETGTRREQGGNGAGTAATSPRPDQRARHPDPRTALTPRDDRPVSRRTARPPTRLGADVHRWRSSAILPWTRGGPEQNERLPGPRRTRHLSLPHPTRRSTGQDPPKVARRKARCPCVPIPRTSR
jgi:hypothetical protein